VKQQFKGMMDCRPAPALLRDIQRICMEVSSNRAAVEKEVLSD
jgi:hypothetical protein